MIDWDRIERVMDATRFSEDQERAIAETVYVCEDDPELVSRYVIWMQEGMHYGA